MNPKDTLFEDDFRESELDLSKWFPHYLPHWSDLERARARYELSNGYLRLKIADDQIPWCPEHDGDVRVSNLQTGHFSGPVGSSVGQHRFKDGLIVRSLVEPRKLFLPQYCRLEMRARARLNPWNLAALWLIGFEDSPFCSGEITVFEAFGSNVSGGMSKIGQGIKKIHDPSLNDEFEEIDHRLELGEWHTYAMEWSPKGTTFFVNGVRTKTSKKSPN